MLEKLLLNDEVRVRLKGKGKDNVTIVSYTLFIDGGQEIIPFSLC